MDTSTAVRNSGPSPPRFVRRTTLAAHEYRKNFRQIDADVILAITSAEADGVTPLVSKIYLRLISAPAEFWEREGVLYFSAGDKAGRPVKASKVLYECLGVASATAHKALRWMHEQGIIGYFAGKNGAGIRIFLNRAASSIGVRVPTAGKKILPFAQGSNRVTGGSSVEPAFNDSFAVSEVLDSGLNPHAPENGAEQPRAVKKAPGQQPPPVPTGASTQFPTPREVVPSGTPLRVGVSVEEIVSRLSRELEPRLQSAARRATAEEYERTREWFESRALPKATRVAQRETFNVLRKYGVIRESAASASVSAGVGRDDYRPDGPKPLSCEEVEELAQTCVALLVAQGRSVERTLSEMSSQAGGLILPCDAPRVRERAEALLAAAGSWQGG